MSRRLIIAAVLTMALGVGAAPVASPRAKFDPLRLARVTRVYYVAARTPRTPLSLGTCPNPTTCQSYKLGRTRWPVDSSGNLALRYRYSDVGRPSRAPASSTVVGALHAAAAEWHRWNSNVSYVDAGTTTARPGARGPGGACGDGINTIGWKTMNPGVLGVAIICYDPDTHQIAEADTALNAVVQWAMLSAPSPATQAFDVRSIITHEIGHWQSLLDLYTRRSRGQTMFGGDEPGSISKRTLALGDIVGSQTAYPCGAGDSCPRSGMAAD
jgi:hypothetical protein